MILLSKKLFPVPVKRNDNSTTKYSNNDRCKHTSWACKKHVLTRSNKSQNVFLFGREMHHEIQSRFGRSWQVVQAGVKTRVELSHRRFWATYFSFDMCRTSLNFPSQRVWLKSDYPDNLLFRVVHVAFGWLTAYRMQVSTVKVWSKRTSNLVPHRPGIRVRLTCMDYASHVGMLKGCSRALFFSVK